MLIFGLFFTVLSYSQNILDVSGWRVSSTSWGVASGFGRNQTAEGENTLIEGENPFGDISVLWRAAPSGDRSADGGWNAPFYKIDPTKTYRFSIWMKKENSQDGINYFGCSKNGSGYIKNIDGSTVYSPKFLAGDLPGLDRWYLVVGYVHGSGYSGGVHEGRIYDGVTGQAVATLKDFKFNASTTEIRHDLALYNDPNPQDRQYFYAPRIDQINGKEPSISDLLADTIDSNLLDTSSWKPGTIGGASGFSRAGGDVYNTRDYGETHVGKQAVLWEGVSNPDNAVGGGFATWYHEVGAHRTVRYSVWIKKTGSQDGRVMFGAYRSSSSHILTLHGGVHSNPPFFNGDLPKLDRWYLLVGYVHKHTYGSKQHLGRIYDGVTGEEVATLQDFKKKSTTTDARMRAFLVYLEDEKNYTDKAYYVDPRMDVIDGSEPSISELLSLHAGSKLTFNYDASGNQVKRFYCADGVCAHAVASRSGKPVKQKRDQELALPLEEDVISREGVISEDTHDHVSELSYRLSPNPTSGILHITLSGKSYTLTDAVSVYDMSGRLVKRFALEGTPSEVTLDLGAYPAGVYVVHMHFSNGEVASQQIIKE